MIFFFCEHRQNRNPVGMGKFDGTKRFHVNEVLLYWFYIVVVSILRGRTIRLLHTILYNESYNSFGSGSSFYFWYGKRTVTFGQVTFSVMWSTQDIRIFSAVAGAFNRKCPAIPASRLADPMAFLMAKNTEADKNSGGSPTAWKSNGGPLCFSGISTRQTYDGRVHGVRVYCVPL